MDVVMLKMRAELADEAYDWSETTKQLKARVAELEAELAEARLAASSLLTPLNELLDFYKYGTKIELVESLEARIAELEGDLAKAKKTIESQQMSIAEWSDVVAQIGRQVGCLASHFSDGNDFIIAKVATQQARIAELEAQLDQDARHGMSDEEREAILKPRE